jgi:phenylacetate-coenzyme A ligase PaaK-like adenylate-forming protein
VLVCDASELDRDVKNVFLGADWWKVRMAERVLDLEGCWKAFASWGSRDTMRAGPWRTVIVNDMVVDAIYCVF